MSTILYAVIALTAAEAEEVAGHLRAQPALKGVAAWFDANRDALYGDLSDLWRPFGGKTIGEMLNEGKPGKKFESRTNLIQELDEEFGDLDTLLESGIAVYFIDVFAPFLPKYRNLALRLDAALAKTENCCFILPYGLSSDSESLISACRNSWQTVFKYYSERGALHRVAVRPAELTNVRSYCQKRVSGGPNPAFFAQLNQLFGSNNPTEPPRNSPA